ncbi:MAG: hypothetical protein WA952_06320, partial [Lewinella sp.]
FVRQKTNEALTGIANVQTLVRCQVIMLARFPPICQPGCRDVDPIPDMLESRQHQVSNSISNAYSTRRFTNPTIHQFPN